MYANCIFCHQPLGTNAVLEGFPVGRRLAFDPARGRLWVVCRKCERWNLSPLEERWEAIEAAEELYRELRMRVATENIGLARHPEGLEFVRIGKPLRPEFAAWRYGDQFGRRRKRALLTGAGAMAAFGALATAGLVTGFITVGLLSNSGTFINLWVNGRVVLRLPTEEGVIKYRRMDLLQSRLLPGPAGEWALELGKRGRNRMVFTGPEAVRVASLVLPRVNSGGAGASKVQRAVQEIERGGGPESYLSAVTSRPPHSVGARGRRDGQLNKLPASTRLALEMALHEEQERRALEGELRELELAWQAAEEVAAIADDLLLPDSVRQALAHSAAEAAAHPHDLDPSNLRS